MYVLDSGPVYLVLTPLFKLDEVLTMGSKAIVVRSWLSRQEARRALKLRLGMGRSKNRTQVHGVVEMYVTG